MEIDKVLVNIKYNAIKRLWALLLISSVLFIFVSAEPQYNKLDSTASSCSGSCNINVSAIYNETDPLWTANSSLVPYLDKDNIFTKSNNYNFDGVYERYWDSRLDGGLGGFGTLIKMLKGNLSYSSSNAEIYNIKFGSNDYGNTDVYNIEFNGKIIGNGSLLTGVCLSNGTGCASTSSSTYNATYDAKVSFDRTNVSYLNNTQVYTAPKNFTNNVTIYNNAGKTNFLVRAGSTEATNGQFFKLQNTAGTTIFYMRQDGYAGVASIGTTDDNSAQIVDSTVSTGDYPRGLNLGSLSVVSWGTNQWWTAKNVGLSRSGSGELAVGNGTQGSYSGRLKTSGLDIFNDGDLRLYGTIPHFLLNESDCPFGNCVNAYIIMDGNRYQIQRYGATGVYEQTVLDHNMRAPGYTLGNDYLGRVGVGGAYNPLGVFNINSSRSYAPQMNLLNSTLATTKYAGSIERKDNDLWFTDNSLNTTQVLISRNTTRYTCDALAKGQVGTNATGSYGCNGSCWGAWNGTAVVCGRRLF